MFGPPGFRRVASCILFLLSIAVILSGCFSSDEGDPGAKRRIGMAVEFMDHAAAAYVAQEKGWFEARGLRLSSYRSYVTGMTLASALARSDIQVAYMCLVPAINVYANAGVPIKIVAGTHRYGYALVADPKVVKGAADLAKPGVRLGCVREGGAVDVLMNRTVERYGLDGDVVRGKARRMNPPRLLLAIRSGQLDAAFLPEQWASMAEDLGFRMLLQAQDLWPHMQGSVLVVKKDLLRDHPDVVRTLVAVTKDATAWINTHPRDAARVLLRCLSVTGEQILPSEVFVRTGRIGMSEAMMLRSMKRLEYTTSISRSDVQDVIDYVARLGYIPAAFPADDLLDTRFLR